MGLLNSICINLFILLNRVGELDRAIIYVLGRKSITKTVLVLEWADKYLCFLQACSI